MMSSENRFTLFGIMLGGEKFRYCPFPKNLRINIWNMLAIEAIPPLSQSLWVCGFIDKNGNG